MKRHGRKQEKAETRWRELKIDADCESSKKKAKAFARARKRERERFPGSVVFGICFACIRGTENSVRGHLRCDLSIAMNSSNSQK